MKSELEIDRERTTCLLLINTQLIKKALQVYNNVLLNPKALSQMQAPDRQQMMEQYQQYTRRIHCNLGVLSYIHDRYHGDPNSGNKVKFPLIISPPPDMQELTPLYNKLQELYPEAVQYLKMKINQYKQQQSQQMHIQQPPPAPTGPSPMNDFF